MLRTQLAVILLLPSLALGAAFKIGGVYDKTSVGLPKVQNLTPAEMPVSTSQQTALDLKADKTSTVTITAPEFNTTSADGTLRANFRNTVTFSATPAIGDCQYASYLSPAGWYCYTAGTGGDPNAWKLQGGDTTALWAQMQLYMLQSTQTSYAAAMQVKFTNMSATVNALRIAVVAGGTYTPPSVVTPPSGGSISDDFNRANGVIGSNWTSTFGTAPIIASNKAEGVVGAQTGAYWSGSTLTANQSSQADIGVVSTTTVTVRMTGTNFYAFGYKGGNWAILKVSGGDDSTVVANCGTAVSGTTLKLKAIGTTSTALTAYLDGVQLCTYTDTTSPFTTGSAGFYMYSNGTVDNFVGANE